MLNPFFIQGTSSEQNLVQDLINEQLKMYGIEVYYMPREFVSEGKIIREVLYSKFTKAFPIEAYLVSYDGFDPNSILMSKFGVKITDEMNLIISKERFETYIGELMKTMNLVKNSLRPNEGDLIYIPLSNSFMEIKYVENRKPFYQLQKNYVYELRCELYEIEDEEVRTTIPEGDGIDKLLTGVGYESELQLSEIGVTATAVTTLVSGGIQTVNLINGGYRYSSTPNINVSEPLFGIKSRVVGIMTGKSSLLSSKSIHKIYIEDPGTGYNPNKQPSITFSGGGGYNASATVGVASSGSIGPIRINNFGRGYVTEPTVTISSPVSWGTTATARAFLNNVGGISTIRIINAGYGYTEIPTITISAGSTVSSGNFIFNETVTGSISKASGLVRNWDAETKILKVSGFGTSFISGDLIVGAASSATYIVKDSGDFVSAQEYDSSDDIQDEFNNIVDFTEVNPFGEV